MSCANAGWKVGINVRQGNLEKSKYVSYTQILKPQLPTELTLIVLPTKLKRLTSHEIQGDCRVFEGSIGRDCGCESRTQFRDPCSTQPV